MGKKALSRPLRIVGIIIVGLLLASRCPGGNGDTESDCNADRIPDRLQLRDVDLEPPSVFGEAATGWLAKVDFDRDGDLDVVSLRSSERGIWFWDNDGHANFNGRQILDRGFTTVAAGDLDADGRTDLVAGWKTATNLEVFFDIGIDPSDRGVTLETGGAAGSIHTPDIDADGAPDIIAAMINFCGCVTAMVNRGGRRFGPPQEFPVAENPAHLAPRDFDGDHHVDLAVANFNGFVVSVLPNLGTGPDASWLGFGPKRNIDLAAHQTWLEVADFDGDGADDLALLHTAPEGVSVLLGDGKGNFSEPRIILEGIGMEAPAMAAADLDGDGAPDLAIADSEKALLRLVLNTGKGQFREARVVPHFSRFVISGDFDADGATELVTGGRGVSLFHVDVENHDCDADGVLDECEGTVADFNLAAARRYDAGDGPSDLGFADLDGDGLLDLATPNFFGDSVSILPGAPRGVFGAAFTIPTGGAPNSIAAIDLDGDGQVDLATANGGTNDVVVLGNKGGSAFVRLGAFPVAVNPQDLIAADLSGDGIPDIATANVDGTVGVLLGKGNGAFLPRRLYSGGRALVRVASGDVDGDGDLDLFAVGFESSDVLLLAGTGNGDFGRTGTVAVGRSPVGIAIADLDADGKLDIATANSSSGDVSILVGNGDMSFQAARSVMVAANASHLVVNDIDGDSVLDLLVASSDASNYYSGLFLLPGDGQGGHRLSWSAPMGSQVARLALKDLDGDGIGEVLTANFAADDISVMLGRKGQPGNAAITVPLPDPPFRVRTVDFNGDGILDLAAVDRRRNSLWIARGREGGSFGDAGPLPVDRNSVWILADDLDGDGDLELAVASFTERTILVFAGNGAGEFARAQILATGDSRSLVAADFDGDGQKDLVAANAQDGNLSFFAGRTGGAFASRQDIDVPGIPLVLAAHDLDADGKPDLAVTLGRDGLGILSGQGDGSFATARLHLGGKLLGPLAAGDLNQDGIVDFVVSDIEFDRVAVVIADRSGGFVEGTHSRAGATVTGLSIADLSGDGVPDVAVSTIPGGLTVFAGLGTASLGERRRFDAGNYAESLDTGDIDGDARMDVVTADSTDRGSVGPKLLLNPTLLSIMDCNGNGVPDSCDIAGGQAADVDRDGVPDSCQTDCDRNGIPDQYEIELLAKSDCNQNQSLDECDVASASSDDVNQNGLPDECESGEQIPGDCSQDGTVDLSDAVCILGALFLGVPAEFPCGDGRPEDSANLSLLDWEPNGVIDISDAISLLLFTFLGGPAAPLAVPGAETSGCRAVLGCGPGPQCE